MSAVSAPRLLDCRKVGNRMSSLSFEPNVDGRHGWVAAHEGRKPVEGDYLALGDERPALYRVTDADWCMNVDPPNMWTAKVEFVPGRETAGLDDLPSEFTS